MAQIPVALQLYTVRDQTADDFSGTLRSVGRLRYEGVEFAGYGGLSADEMKALLAETGLQAAGTHVSLETLEEDLDAQIDYCLAIGCPYLVVPWLAPQLRQDVPSVAARLNDIGRRCKDRAITFGYHNHDWEFVRSDGATFMNRLLDATDPELVALELDIGWASYGGVDPIAVLRERTGRVPLVHVKDFGANRESVDVGEGTLDWRAILPVARQAGARWYIVENDEPSGPSVESARRSLEYLRGMPED